MKKKFFVLRLTISLQMFKLMAHDKTECLKKNLSVLEHFLMRCNECNLYFAFQQIFSMFSKSLAYHQYFCQVGQPPEIFQFHFH